MDTPTTLFIDPFVEAWSGLQRELVSHGIRHASTVTTAPWTFAYSVWTAAVHSDPLVQSFALAIWMALLCWVLSLLTDNYSWVDRYWSLAPPIYATIMIVGGTDFTDSNGVYRPVALLVLLWMWGVRLTYNFARKGGYWPSAEDYRWTHVRQRIVPRNAIAWHLFNFAFIALYQNVLLWLIAVPVYVLMRSPVNPLVDGLFVLLFLVFWTGELVADHQQWTFHQQKHSQQQQQLSRSGRPLRSTRRSTSATLPFLTHGLFRYSRHPNFFCELSMWWTLFIWSLYATHGHIWWQGLGCVLLTLLFQASTRLTETLSVEKYPQYVEYQQTTSRLIPWFPGATGGDLREKKAR